MIAERVSSELPTLHLLPQFAASLDSFRFDRACDGLSDSGAEEFPEVPEFPLRFCAHPLRVVGEDVLADTIFCVLSGADALPEVGGEDDKHMGRHVVVRTKSFGRCTCGLS